MNSIKNQIDQDIKEAMLSGNKSLATTLRGLKSAILYTEVAQNKRDEGLDDDGVIAVLQKEAKKRQESADLYAKGGNSEKQNSELAEKTAIEKYLPTPISDGELIEVVHKVIGRINASGIQDMGKVIGAVKQQLGASADGSRIALVVKQELAEDK